MKIKGFLKTDSVSVNRNKTEKKPTQIRPLELHVHACKKKQQQ